LNSATDPIFRLNTKNPDAVISIIDESLEINANLRCELLASISSKEIALALFHKKQNKFLALEVFQLHETSLPEIPGKSSILKRGNYSSVSVEIINELSTIVPAALFHQQDAEKYYHFNFGSDDLLIQAEPITSYDAVNVFASSREFSESLNSLFGKHQVHHHAAVLLQGIHLSFNKMNGKLLVVNIRQDYIDIIVTEGKQLKLINSFNYKTTEDILYYVLFVCDRLQLNPESTQTYLMGQIEKESAAFHMLYKYIKELTFASHPGTFEFSYLFGEIPAHYYFNLFSLPLCES
jgi:hypothetical protein